MQFYKRDVKTKIKCRDNKQNKDCIQTLLHSIQQQQQKHMFISRIIYILAMLMSLLFKNIVIFNILIFYNLNVHVLLMRFSNFFLLSLLLLYLTRVAYNTKCMFVFFNSHKLMGGPYGHGRPQGSARRCKWILVTKSS